MGFYDINKAQRAQLVEKITKDILDEIPKGNTENIIHYFSDEDAYIRKAAYMAIGKIYKANPKLRLEIIDSLEALIKSVNEKVRQTAINAAGEIGINEFNTVEVFFDTGLFDTHHSVRNAVIGSVKKMGEKNPEPVLKWASKYLHHYDKEVRREICHGIELRGRTHPQDILSLLKELQFDKTARVKTTLIHVLGQISYKKGCLITVLEHLKFWENKALVSKALTEIVDVHQRYREFAALTPEEVTTLINENYGNEKFTQIPDRPPKNTTPDISS